MRIVMEREQTFLVVTKMDDFILYTDNQFYQDACVEMDIMRFYSLVQLWIYLLQ